MKKVSLLGDGAWGTALATVLSDNGFQVILWCYDEEVADHIRNTRENKKYLPGVILASSIVITTDLAQAVEGAEWVFEAVPVKYLRSILKDAAPYYHHQQTWVLLSKGIEQNSLLLPSQIIDDVYKKNVQKAIISGPSFAYDLARKQPTAVDYACPQFMTAPLKKMLHNNYFHLCHTTDMIGVQVGGALKNIVALGMGMLHGAGYGDNAKAWVITQAIKEMQHLASKMGGNPETIIGLSGIGDLVLTSHGKHSKNRRYGEQWIQGEMFNDNEPEAVNTSKAIDSLITRYDLHLPLFSAISQIVNNGKPLDYIFEVMDSACSS